ncbi:hypothetical protein GCM10022252_49830 [Streptosporangium oxazolinicum]|uniref:Uncharacterized protein n=1 Tax=Streptosporangium oxazolinicum TaxID=909287 RepID=A0ABP8B5T7_9ACTN
MGKLHGDDDLAVTFYCKDPNSNFQNDCATFYRTNRGSWVVQGDSMAPEVAPKLTALADHETYLEIPDALANRFARMYVRERYGVDLPEGP